GRSGVIFTCARPIFHSGSAAPTAGTSARRVTAAAVQKPIRVHVGWVMVGTSLLPFAMVAGPYGSGFPTRPVMRNEQPWKPDLRVVLQLIGVRKGFFAAAAAREHR